MADRVVLSGTITMDSSPFLRSAQTARGEMKALNKQLNSQSKAFKQTGYDMDALAERSDMLYDSIAAQTKILAESEKQYKNVSNKIKDKNNMTTKETKALQYARAEVIKNTNSLKGLGNELDKVRANQTKLQMSTDDLRKSQKDLELNNARVVSYYKKMGKETQALQANYKGLQKEINENNIILSKEKDALTALSKTMSKSSQEYMRQSKIVDDVRKKHITLINSQDRVSTSLRKLTGDTDTNIEHTRRFGAVGAATVKTWRTLTTATHKASATINRLGSSFRNIGLVVGGMALGGLIQNLSTLVPLGGSLISVLAGLGGMLTALGGGAIGLGGAFGIAGVAVKLFAGQAKTALQMVEDGTMESSAALTQYKSSLSGLQNQWKNLVKANAGAIFGTMSNGINMARFALTTLNPFLTKTANQILAFSDRMKSWVTSSRNAQAAFGMLNGIGPKVFQNILNAVFKVTDGLARLTVQFSPLFTWVSAGLEKMAGSFNKWANSVSTHNGITAFIEYTKRNLPVTLAIFGNVFGGIVGLFQAFAGHSEVVMRGMAGVTNSFKVWAQNLQGTEGFKQFIAYLEENGPKVWQLLKNLGSIAVNLIVGLAPVGQVMLDMAVAMSGFFDVITRYPAIGALVGVLAAFVGIVWQLAPVVIMISQLIGVLGGLSAIAAVVTNPITWIVVGIAALATAFVVAYKKSETFRNIVNGALEGVVNGFKAMWAGIKFVGTAIGNFIMKNIIQPIASFGAKIIGQIQAFWAANGPMIMQAIRNVWSIAQPILMALFNLFKTVFQGILGVVVAVLKGLWMVAAPILTFFKNSFMAVWNFIVLSFRNVWNVIKGVISGALTVILGIVKVFAGIFTGNWSAVWSGLKMIVSGVVQVVVTIFKGLWTSIINIIGFFGTMLKNAWLLVWGVLKGVVMGAIGIIVAIIKGAFNGILAFFNYIWTAIKTAALIAWNGIKFVIMTPIQALISWIRIIFGGIRTFFTVIWNAIRNTVVARAVSLKAGVQAAWNLLRTVTFAIFNAVRGWIVSVWNNIRARVVAVARLVWSGVRAAWNLLRSSTMAIFGAVRGFVVMIWTTIKNRVVSQARLLWSIVRGVWNALSRISRAIFSNVRNFIVSVWNNLRARVVATARVLWNMVRNIWNTLSRVSRAIFSNVRNFVVAVWTNLRNRVVGVTRLLWNIVRNVWNTLSRTTRNIFNNVRNFIVRIWTYIKNRVSHTVKVLWAYVKAIFIVMSRRINAITTGIRNFLVSLWTNIRNRVVGFARSLWSKVSGTWNSLSRGTRNIFNKVRNYLVDKWEGIKNKVSDIVSGLWGAVKKTFTNMKNGIKGLAGKIGDTITGMVDGIKKGLNALIKGVNWVAKKLGVDKKIPPLHTGTAGANHSGSGIGAGVSNGAVSSPGLAVVNDRGRGNGTGIGGHQEVIQKANGTMIAPKGRDVTVPLEKGDIVHSGRSVQKAQRAGALPKFASGTGKKNILMRGAKKHKKDDELFGDVAGEFNLSGGGKLEDAQKWFAGQAGGLSGKLEGGKKKVAAGAKAGAKVVKDKIGDLLDYVGNPGKLFDAILGKFGVKFPKINGEIPKDMMWDPMWKTLKNATKSLFDGWLEDADGGDGGYIDLSKGINFPFSPHGRAPGYPFAGPHMGVDINYVYDKLYSVLGGKATARKGWNGGFGDMVDIVKGNLKVIYGHMSKHAFSGSKQVKPGDYLGVSGNSGRSSGPHLHFEVQKNGKPIDPIKWLKDNDGGGGNGKWKSKVKQAAKATGVSLSNGKLKDILKLIQTESGGRAGVKQQIQDVNSGSNAARGLLQYTPSTFRGYATKGKKNILNGYHQLMAFFNNSNWSGDLASWKRRMARGSTGWGPTGSRRGYAKGTDSARAGFANVFEKGGEIMNLRGGEQIIPNDVSINALKSMMSSDLFARTQSAVYAGISQYADALRQQEAQTRAKELQARQQANASSNEIAELKAMVADMVYLMQAQLGVQENIAGTNQQIANNPINLDGKEITKNVSQEQALQYMLQNHSRGI